jgi:beta-lactamase class D
MVDLVGFTLFQHPGRGWQMSTRIKGEDGWFVGYVDDAYAQELFDRLKDIDAQSAKKALPNLDRIFNQEDRQSAYKKAQKPNELFDTSKLEAAMPSRPKLVRRN